MPTVAGAAILLLALVQYNHAALKPDKAILEFARIPRQAEQSDNSRCSNVLLMSQCSTTNYIQNILNELSQCGSVGAVFISAFEGLCRQNPGTGDYCGSLLSTSIDSILMIPQVCGSSCSPECRSNLTSLVSSNGCCVESNTIINGLFSQFFNTCQIAMPSACPASSLTIPSPSSSSSASCTIGDVQSLLVQSRCSRDNIPPLQAALRSANCDAFATSLEGECSFRNGRYCSIQISESTTTTSLASAVTACPSASTCSSECLSQITRLNDDLGCCINYVNGSFRVDTSTTLASFRTVTSNELWSSCGVTPPGVCEVRLSKAVSLGPTISAIIVLIACMMMKFVIV